MAVKSTGERVPLLEAPFLIPLLCFLSTQAVEVVVPPPVVEKKAAVEKPSNLVSVLSSFTSLIPGSGSKKVFHLMSRVTFIFSFIYHLD